MGKLLIATWGSPAEWGNVSYVVEGGEGGGRVESCTTLIPLYKSLCSGGCDVVVIALDSLVDLQSSGDRSRGDGICSECCGRYRGLLGGDWESYADLRGAVRKFVEGVVECVGGGAGVYITATRVIVAPAVGSPGGTWRFVGKAQDFESVVLYELGKLVLEKRYDEIVLDLTHGINFMPSVTLRVAYRLASTSLIAHKGINAVGLRVYNSDPYRRIPRGAGGEGRVPEANINLVIKDSVRNIQLVHEIPSPVRPLTKLDDTVNEEVSKFKREFFRAVGLAYSSLYYPLPLALCAAVETAEPPLKTVERAFELWLNSVEVRERSVNRKLCLNPDAFYISTLVEAAVRRLRGLGYPTRISELQNIAELYDAVNHSYHSIIGNEVSQIKEAVESAAPGEAGHDGWVRYCELIRDCRDVERPDKRIMTAHAGLQKEFVEVSPLGLIRYVGNVEKILENSGLILSRSE